ncbi:hypothetical protein C8R42DRAFT_124329 [Lentinula raphanica]|nr:hypothetical protein C8R42DRAFT_124329 [Lentinula raphanica]
MGTLHTYKLSELQPVLDLPGVGSNSQGQIGLFSAKFSAPPANTTNITADINALTGIMVTHPTARDVLGWKSEFW